MPIRYAILMLVLCAGCTSIKSIPPGALIENKIHKVYRFESEFTPSFGGRVTPHSLLAIAGQDYFRVKWVDGTVSEWKTPQGGNKTLVFTKPQPQTQVSRIPRQALTQPVARPRPQRDSRPPEITIISPPVTPGMRTGSTAKHLVVRGRATDESGVYEVLVNDEEATLSANGYFTATILLAIGDNKIQIKATDTKRNVKEMDFTVVRGQLLPPPTVVPTTH